MKGLFIAAIFAASIISAAAHARETSEALYVGGGLQYLTGTYKSGAADSTFNGFGGSAIIGSGLSSGSFRLFIEGEYGFNQLLNTFPSTTYMEKATNTFYGGKIGMAFDAFGIGGGVQQNAIDIDNVASSGTSGRNSYRGLSYNGFVRLTFDGRGPYQTILEVKYGVGRFSGLDLAETQANLRFVFLPF